METTAVDQRPDSLSLFRHLHHSRVVQDNPLWSAPLNMGDRRLTGHSCFVTPKYMADMEGSAIFPPSDPEVHRLSQFAHFSTLPGGQGIFAVTPELLMGSRGDRKKESEYSVGQRLAVGIYTNGDVALFLARAKLHTVPHQNFTEACATAFQNQSDRTVALESQAINGYVKPQTHFVILEGKKGEIDQFIEPELANFSRRILESFWACQLSRPERIYLVRQFLDQKTDFVSLREDGERKVSVIPFSSMFDRVALGFGALGVFKKGDYDRDGMLHAITIDEDGVMAAFTYPRLQEGATPSRATFADAVAFKLWGIDGRQALHDDLHQGRRTEQREFEQRESEALAAEIRSESLSDYIAEVGGYRGRAIAAAIEMSPETRAQIARKMISRVRFCAPGVAVMG